MGEKRVINLEAFDGLGLIIRHPSGVFYTNLVGGVGCFHTQIEGVFVPLEVDTNRYELIALTQHFRSGGRPIDENDANVVDAVLRRSTRNLHWISVDRSYLNESFEAWVCVKLDLKKMEQQWLLTGFGNALGILTWQNSD